MLPTFRRGSKKKDIPYPRSPDFFFPFSSLHCPSLLYLTSVSERRLCDCLSQAIILFQDKARVAWSTFEGSACHHQHPQDWHEKGRVSRIYATGAWMPEFYSLSYFWHLHIMPCHPPPPDPRMYVCMYVHMHVFSYLLIYLLMYNLTILVFPIRSILLICASEVPAGLNTLHCLIHFYRNNTIVPRGVLPFPDHSCFPWSHTFFPFTQNLIPWVLCCHTAAEEKLDYAKNINTEKTNVLYWI